MGTACPAMFCDTSESAVTLRGLCHGDDFVVTASRRRLAGVRRVAHGALGSTADSTRGLRERRG